jgi:hypothetical protein
MRRFVLEFLGGCWHEKSLDSHSPDHDEVILAQAIYFLVGDGTIGRKILGLTAEAIQFARKREWLSSDQARTDAAKCDYMVIDRREEGERTVVVLKHGAKP